MSLWKIDQIRWNKFDAQAVDLRCLRLAKGACLVEANSRDYVDYLQNIFRDDPEFCDEIAAWGEDEKQHGQGLRLWAEKADPSFDFERSLEKFRSVFRIDVGSETSIRGSRPQELVARCLVETGTATYYSALADASDEPVFKQICKFIAADEIHHYKLFYDRLKSYEEKDGLSRLGRVKTAIQRSVEIEDEELALAYACGNYPDRDIRREDFREYSREFLSLGYGLYREPHIAKGAKLALNAAGLPTSPWLTKPVAKLMTGIFRLRQRQTSALVETLNS